MYSRGLYFGAVVFTGCELTNKEKNSLDGACLTYFPVRHLLFVPQVEAHILAGAKLMKGASDAQAERPGWSTNAPACYGQAYFITDDQPCNPQTSMDSIFERLGEYV